MNETSKAMQRRGIEDRTGVFPWRNEIFVGNGIDVGSGDDKLPFACCQAFDKEQGDANFLDKHIEPESMDYLHSSQSLEHMDDPNTTIISWLRVLKPGGHMIVTVPDWCLYEKMVWPSRFNPDHKSTWSIWMPGSPAPKHVLIPKFLQNLADLAVTRRFMLVDTNYNYFLSSEIDQTLGNAEAFIEFVLQKRHPNETKA